MLHIHILPQTCLTGKLIISEVGKWQLDVSWSLSQFSSCQKVISACWMSLHQIFPKLHLCNDAASSSWLAVISVTKDYLYKYQRVEFYWNTALICDWFIWIVSDLISNNCLLREAVRQEGWRGSRTHMNFCTCTKTQLFCTAWFGRNTIKATWQTSWTYSYEQTDELSDQ